MFGMPIMSGTVYNMQKMMKLQAKYAQKRQNGFKKEEEEKPLTEKQQLIKQLRKMQEDNDATSVGNACSTIYAKLESGKKLSPNEMAYLKENDPETYEKAVKIQKEREQYERELKSCKTKDDVSRLHNQKMLSAASELATIKNNPNISDAKKLEFCHYINAKINNNAAELNSFTATEKYKNMPTDAEEAKRAEDENTSATEKAQEIAENETDKNSETENVEKADSTAENDDSQTNQSNDAQIPSKDNTAKSKADVDTKVKSSENSNYKANNADTQSNYTPQTDINILAKYPFMLDKSYQASQKLNVKI